MGRTHAKFGPDPLKTVAGFEEQTTGLIQKCILDNDLHPQGSTITLKIGLQQETRTAVPGGLDSRLCRVFLVVFSFFFIRPTLGLWQSAVD